MKIYVGNLPYTVTSEDLSEMFKEHGGVEEVTIIMDRDTGRSKGFAFVDMPNNSDADRAIKKSERDPSRRPCAHGQSGAAARESPARRWFFPTLVTRADHAGRCPSP